MQIPMEALFLVTPRTDSGEITRPKPQTAKDDFLFGKMLEAAKNGAEPARADFHGSEKMAEYKPAIPFVAEKRGKFEEMAEQIDDEAMSLAAGVIMGNQNKVVFILEGDKESGTEPELNIDAAMDNAADVISLTDEAMPEAPLYAPKDNDAEFETAQAENEIREAVEAAVAGNTAVLANTTETVKADETVKAVDVAEAVNAAKPAQTDEKAVETEAADSVDEPAAQVYAGSAAAGDTKTEVKDVSNAADADEAKVDETGEVTARMPAIRTSERSEKQDAGGETGKNASESFEDGYLSPLENENDKPMTRVRKDKDYIKAEGAADNPAKTDETPASGTTATVAADIRPERFRADQMMGRAAEAPVSTESLFDKMVSQIETNMLDDVRTMTIQLKPEFLGKVAIELALDTAGLHLKINADDQSVSSMVNSQINALIETLQNKGIEVVEVEVAYTGVYDGEFADPRKGDAQQPQSPKRTHRVDDTAALEDVTYYSTAAPIEMMEYYVETGVSSVEYRA